MCERRLLLRLVWIINVRLKSQIQEMCSKQGASEQPQAERTSTISTRKNVVQMRWHCCYYLA